MDGQTDRRTEFVPILQDLSPIPGPLPKKDETCSRQRDALQLNPLKCRQRMDEKKNCALSLPRLLPKWIESVTL